MTSDIILGLIFLVIVASPWIISCRHVRKLRIYRRQLERELIAAEARNGRD